MNNQNKINWNERYLNTKVTDMPWYNPELDIDLQNTLTELKITSGTFLDLGTGPATQAQKLSEMGFSVSATDISEKAISLARHTFKGIEFIEDDILETKLSKKFDYIFDRGCFHVIDADLRKIYSENVYKLLNVNGMLFLKCFSNRMPETEFGPHRISEEIINDTFGQKFDIKKIFHTNFNINLNNPRETKAIFTILQKK